KISMSFSRKSDSAHHMCSRCMASSGSFEQHAIRVKYCAEGACWERTCWRSRDLPDLLDGDGHEAVGHVLDARATHGNDLLHAQAQHVLSGHIEGCRRGRCVVRS